MVVWIGVLAQERSLAPVVVPRLQVREICLRVFVLPNVLFLPVKAAELLRYVRRAVRVVVENFQRRARPVVTDYLSDRSRNAHRVMK